MSGTDSDGGRVRRVDVVTGTLFDLEEFRRRNVNAVAMDLLYLFTTAFFATLAVKGFWPAVIAAVPLAVFLYFAWKSSTAFFLVQLAVIAVTVTATYAGVVPL